MGTREIIFLNAREVERTFSSRTSRGELPKDRLRQTINRENRVVKVQFQRHMSPEEVKRLLRGAFTTFEFIHGHRVQRAKMLIFKLFSARIQQCKSFICYHFWHWLMFVPLVCPVYVKSPNNSKCIFLAFFWCVLLYYR